MRDESKCSSVRKLPLSPHADSVRRQPLFLYQPGKKGNFIACCLWDIVLGGCALCFWSESAVTVHRAWQIQAGATQGCMALTAPSAQAVGPPHSCYSHIWRAEEATCVSDTSRQSCALWLVLVCPSPHGKHPVLCQGGDQPQPGSKVSWPEQRPGMKFKPCAGGILCTSC